MPADGVEPGRGDGFAFALILISSDQLKTVPVGIADLYNAMVIDWSMIMPAGMLVIVPGVTVFVCVQRYLVAGWGAGAVKGRTFAPAQTGAAVVPAGRCRGNLGSPAKGDCAMTVRRIVANIAAADPDLARAFYERLLDLKVVMDHGWILTFAAATSAAPQLSVASEGGSGTPVPDLSIEVDDVDQIHQRAIAAKCEIIYGITDEPWGVRRFFVRDPFGKILNILSHSD